MSSMTCPKCQGTGNIPCFSHVEAGVCFKCRGAGAVAAQAAPVAPRAPVDHANTLRNLYRAAKSQGESGWAQFDEKDNTQDGYDFLGKVIYHLEKVNPSTRKKALKALLPMSSPYVASRLQAVSA